MNTDKTSQKTRKDVSGVMLSGKVKPSSFHHAKNTDMIRMNMDKGKVIIADTFLTRLRGVKSLKNPAKGIKMVLRNCRMIHTFGVKYDLEIRFLDKNDREIKRIERLKPWRVAIGPRGTAAVVETVL